MRLIKGQKKEKSAYTASVPAVDEASRILICLSRNTSFKMNLTDICSEVGIHKSKGYSILSTLQTYGFVRKHPEEKTYSLGPGLISLSRKVLDNLDYREVAAPFLERLALNTHSTAFLGITNNGSVFVVAKHEGDRNIGVTIRLGHRFSNTAGAHGKAITAFMSEEDRTMMLQREKLFFHGDPVKLDRDRLTNELKECRERGFAFDIGELNPGINAIASPVFRSRGKLSGSLFIIGTFQMTQVPAYGAMVAGTAREISRMLGADADKIFNML